MSYNPALAISYHRSPWGCEYQLMFGAEKGTFDRWIYELLVQKHCKNGKFDQNNSADIRERNMRWAVIAGHITLKSMNIMWSVVSTELQRIKWAFRWYTWGKIVWNWTKPMHWHPTWRNETSCHSRSSQMFYYYILYKNVNNVKKGKLSNEVNNCS